MVVGSSCCSHLKSIIDKLYIDEAKNVWRNLRNSESKVDQLHVGKLPTVPVDLSKLSDVVKKIVVKEDVHKAKITNIEDKRPDITNLPTNTANNTKINQFKGLLVILK